MVIDNGFDPLIVVMFYSVVSLPEGIILARLTLERTYIFVKAEIFTVGDNTLNLRMRMVRKSSDFVQCDLIGFISFRIVIGLEWNFMGSTRT